MYKQLYMECSNDFEQAVRTLSVADEVLQRQFRGQLSERWSKLEIKMSGLQSTVQGMVSMHCGSVSEKLDLIEKQIKNMESLLNDMHGVIKTEEELQLYIERLQV
jgi:nesprin-1